MKGNFQLIVTIVFIVLAIFGVLVFSGVIPIGSEEEGSLGTVVIWGTVKEGVMAVLLEEFNYANPAFVIQYVEKSAESVDQELLEALAEGRGPDMFFLPDDLAYHYSNKIVPIAYQSFPVAAFKNTFAAPGEVYLTSKGILAFPLAVDPLVMYYNRSMLDAAGIVYPPAYWDELTSMAPVLTKKDQANKIEKSAVALGHFTNITHAKDILAMLFMQAGNPIVFERDGEYESSLDNPTPKYTLASTLKFYTDFADPSLDVYSWNKSSLNSSDAFSREDLAFYFGYASELVSLINRNPNQNFLAAAVPQIRDANYKLTKSRVMGIALLASSRNFNTAFTAASLMATGDFAAKFATATGMAPARRDLLETKPLDAYYPVFYGSALYGRSWLDPSPKDTNDIFRRMNETVLSNSLSIEDAIKDASGKLDLLLLK